MNKKRVLVTGVAGNGYGNQVLKCLLDCDKIEVYGGDIIPNISFPGLVKYKNFPRANEHSYLECLLEYCVENKINYIF